ncbi:MAG: 54S ribosomal protein L22, mitochondrial [Phylliscum demangeonii]|nr:MAG: 54S ribosomal protein L22, mitochondrial [Phylliscum demangeonii]
MAISTSVSRLVRPGLAELWHGHPTASYPRSRQPLSLSVASHRSIFGWGRKTKADEPGRVENPVYAEYLKKKPPPPPKVAFGDLAGDSIFDSEDAGPAASPRKAGGKVRDANVMAAVLDPRPHVTKRWLRKMVIRDVRRNGRVTRREAIKKTERESLSKSHMIKTSVKKLGPLARQIAGKSLDEAIVQMRFSKKKAAREVKAHLEHARNEAIVRRGMGLGEVDGTKGEPVQIELRSGKRKVVTDRTSLYIDQAWVGRGEYGAEPEYRARGRINILRPPVTSISVVLKEEATRIRQHVEREEKRRNRKLWQQLPNRPITAQRPYYTW